jgi:hypothetical protein
MPWSADPCPHDNRPPFPGLHGFIRTLTGGRASVRTVQRWAAGSRPAPVWFRSVLQDQLLVQRNAIDEALQGLSEYRGGRGQCAGLLARPTGKRTTGALSTMKGTAMVPAAKHSPPMLLAHFVGDSRPSWAHDPAPRRRGPPSRGHETLGGNGYCTHSPAKPLS